MIINNNIKNIITYTLLIVVFFLALSLFWFEGKPIITKMFDKIIYIYGFIGIVVSINLYFLNRLNVTDALDELRTHHIKMIEGKVSFFKKRLTTNIAVAIAIGIIFFISSLGIENDYVILFLTFYIPLVLVYIANYVFAFTSIYSATDNLILNITMLKRKEKKRKELILKLKEEKKENPIDASDEHISNYYKVDK